MKKYIIILILPLLLVAGCKKNGTGVIFPVANDKKLGAKVDAEIKESGEFAILDRSTNTEAYAYIEAMKNDILNKGEGFLFKDVFDWELNIIEDDSTLNAFCTPGGYIYVYTGLIKYLENSSSLAGVMGHEMAHADRRHSSKQMQQEYGISILVQIISGDEEPGMLTKIAANLSSLAFSRADETQADEYSVKYLCPTDFDAAGAANFFQKLTDSGAASPPAFLSTHPSPANRVEAIHTNADALSCSPDEVDPVVNGMTYAEFQAIL